MKKSEFKLFLRNILTEAKLLEATIQDPSKDEMFNYLRSMYGNEESFRDNAEVAIYWFANFYHGGQSSNLYSALSTSRFSPGPIARGPEKDSMEEMMYEDLVLKFAPGSEESIEIQQKHNSLNEGFRKDLGGDLKIYKDREAGKDVYWMDNKDTGGKIPIKPESVSKYIKQGYRIVDMTVTENDESGQSIDLKSPDANVLYMLMLDIANLSDPSFRIILALKKSIEKRVTDKHDKEQLIKVFNKEFGGGHIRAGNSAWDYYRQENLQESLNEAYEQQSQLKKQIYSALQKEGFQQKGSTPREYMEFYISGFATVSCVVNVYENYIFFDRYYDNERIDSMEGHHIEKKVQLTGDLTKDEELAKKVIATVIKLKKSIENDESIFGGIDDIDEGDEADAVNDMWAGSDDDLKAHGYTEPKPSSTKKQKSKQFFGGSIQKKPVKTVQDIDWERVKNKIDRDTLREENETEDPRDALYVEYMGTWGNEKPFLLKTPNGKEKFEYCKGKYPDGKEDIAVYSYRGDLCYGYKAWQKLFTPQTLKENQSNIRVDYGVLGLEGIEPTYHATVGEAWTAARKFIEQYATPKAKAAGEYIKKFDDGYALRQPMGNAVAIAIIRRG